MSLQTIKENYHQVRDTCVKYSDFIKGGVIVISAIVLLALALTQSHFTQVTPNWVKGFSARVLQTNEMGLLKISLFYIGAGTLGSLGICLIKRGISNLRDVQKPQKDEGRLFKLNPLIKREIRFLSTILKIAACFAGLVITFYAINYLMHLKTVSNFNPTTDQFYSLGYLDKGHGIEYSFAALALGPALSTWAFTKLIDGGR